MLPLGDESRTPSRVPVATIVIIAVNAIAFLLELGGGELFVARWAATPAEIASGHHLETLLTSMFLHGGWLHIIDNMVFLWAFGPEVEDSMGALRFAAFYLLGGMLSMLAQVIADPSGGLLALGASGAIAAVMGAFLVTYPTDRIKTVIFFGFWFGVRLIPAIALIGIWFVLQFLNLGAVADVQQGGVAYAAHVAGAVFGALTARLFQARQGAGERTS
jgi:membrane associated rhomboid family serine protease